MTENIEIEKIVQLARDAGTVIMEIYEGNVEVEHKDDRSPLTAADKASNKLITDWLKEHYPEIPIISEENKLLPFSERRTWNMFWLVDPLDGTKEFIKKNGEFTVNIALVKQGAPILGVVHTPAKKETFYAVKGEGSFKIAADGKFARLSMAPFANGDVLKIVGSRSHSTPEMEEYVSNLRAKHGNVEFVAAGSSLKFCLVAEGIAHEYPRLGPTMEWDTGAGQIVAEEAGARVLNAETLEPLKYNKENLLNPYFLVLNPQVSQQ